jgi:hypothetical protein
MPKKLLLIALLAFGLFFEPSNPPNSDGEIFLYRAVEKVAPKHFPLNQGSYGSCVAFAHSAACDILNARWIVEGGRGKFCPVSPDSIYGGSRCEAWNKTRTGGGQGSTGIGAVKWLCESGGQLFQQPYTALGVDLSSYSIPRTANWGSNSNGGDNKLDGPLDLEAKKHPIKQRALVRTVEELDAALAAGCPVTICSGQGFASTRDKDGFCRPSGSWSHALTCVGKRNDGRKGYLILNSWGPNWVKGPKYKDQPEGSFYAEPYAVARMLKAGDSWALSHDFKKVKLFPWLTNPNATPNEFYAVEPPPEVSATPPAQEKFAMVKVCNGNSCRYERRRIN